jgi:hypothetical protein
LSEFPENLLVLLIGELYIKNRLAMDELEMRRALDEVENKPLEKETEDEHDKT